MKSAIVFDFCSDYYPLYSMPTLGNIGILTCTIAEKSKSRLDEIRSIRFRIPFRV